MTDQMQFEFDGETYDPEQDRARLTGQMLRVFDVMCDGLFRTPDEIMRATGDRSSASITARLRDMRKDKFGGHTVHRQRRGKGSEGVHEYRLEVRK